MINNIFESDQSSLIKRALDVYQKQHEGISKNVANIGTDGYKRTNTDFSHELNVAKSARLRSTSSKHNSNGIPRESTAPIEGNGGGTVNLTEEMANLAENQIRYEFATRALRGLYRGLSASITGRMK